MKTLLIFLLFSQFAYAIEEKAVLEQLMGIHGSNWNAIAKSESDYLEVKNILTKVINGDLDLSQHGYTGDITNDLTQNAISEFGNFVTIDSQGKIDSNDKTILQKIKSDVGEDWSGHDALAYYQLLKNAGSTESLDMLSETLTYTQDLSTLYAIERSIHLSLEGNSKEKQTKNYDNSYIEYFRPNLEKSWEKRSGNWDEILKKITWRLEKAEEVIKQKSQDQRFVKTFGDLKLKIIEISKNKKEEKNQVLIKQSSKEEPPQKTVQNLDKKVEREISGIEDDIEESSKETYWWILGFFGLVFTYFIRSVFKR